MKRNLKLFLTFLITCCTTATWAVGTLADITVHDRHDGKRLSVYEHDGRYYVVGKPGNRYQIVVRSQSGESLLAVTSVDGVNVVSGETAHMQQSGYVLSPYGQTDIKGWRKSLNHVAQFYFTSLSDSYAARTGRPNDVGVIGVALFRAKPEPVAIQPYDDELAERDSSMPNKAKSAAGAAPAAPSVGREEAARDRSAPLADKKIGTGHGRNETSPTRYVDFERASESPDEIVAIYYDSYHNLVAQGVISAPRAARVPAPFPGQFVPDPQY